MSNVIPLNYQGRPVRFNCDGWINATEIAKREGKRLDKWLATQETQDYMLALGRHLNTPEKGDLIQTQRGRNGGTGLHPKLAVSFARWMSADFAVWCDLKIDALLRDDRSALSRFNRICKKFDDRKAVASDCGRNLNNWKREKPLLICEIERGRELLQMTLGLHSPIQPRLQASK